jgi:hypothetical protein
MGCRWKTRGGKRMRAAPVEGPRSIVSMLTFNVLNFLTSLAITFVHASPALTIEELREATLRLWKDPELGYFVEARFKPGAPPIYHSITTAEATALEAGRPTPDFIARMFHPVRVEDTFN